MSEPDMEAVTEIFQELEFRRLTDNFLKTFATETETTSKTTKLPSRQSKTKASPKEQKSAGAGQFSLFGGDPSVSKTETTSEYTRNTAETTSHFYQSVAPGMATKLFIKNLMSQTCCLF